MANVVESIDTRNGSGGFTRGVVMVCEVRYGLRSLDRAERLPSGEDGPRAVRGVRLLEPPFMSIPSARGGDFPSAARRRGIVFSISSMRSLGGRTGDARAAAGAIAGASAPSAKRKESELDAAARAALGAAAWAAAPSASDLDGQKRSKSCIKKEADRNTMISPLRVVSFSKV